MASTESTDNLAEVEADLVPAPMHARKCFSASHPQPLLSGFFSLLKQFTEQQQTSLEDYIETDSI